MNKGKFIVVEAPDGAGKTTLVKNLQHLFLNNNKDVVLVKEPYDGLEIGKFVRSWAKSHDFTQSKLDTLQALFMFSASRIEMLKNIVLPALHEDKIVICDRFALSTAVYQGITNDPEISDLIAHIMDNLKNYIHVDYTVYLYMQPKAIIDRLKARKIINCENNDILDNRVESIMNQICSLYNIMLSGIKFPKTLIGNIVRIDASENEKMVAENTFNYLKQAL